MCPVAWYPVESLRAEPLLLYEPDTLLDEAGNEILVGLHHVLQEADARLGLRCEGPAILPLTLLRQGLQPLLLQFNGFSLKIS